MYKNYINKMKCHQTHFMVSHIILSTLQPENILVELGGSQPQLKLVDLGSAIETLEGASNAGREVLPPAPAQLEFAPPECVLGRPPAPAWDAWAAGVFLYVFLTGVRYIHTLFHAEKFE